MTLSCPNCSLLRSCSTSSCNIRPGTLHRIELPVGANEAEDEPADSSSDPTLSLSHDFDLSSMNNAPFASSSTETYCMNRSAVVAS